jgi:hypothetical protein
VLETAEKALPRAAQLLSLQLQSGEILSSSIESFGASPKRQVIMVLGRVSPMERARISLWSSFVLTWATGQYGGVAGSDLPAQTHDASLISFGQESGITLSLS